VKRKPFRSSLQEKWLFCQQNWKGPKPGLEGVDYGRVKRYFGLPSLLEASVPADQLFLASCSLHPRSSAGRQDLDSAPTTLFTHTLSATN
jgi:hypothetical protein